MKKKKPSRKSLNRKKDVLGNRTNPNDSNLLCLGANNSRISRGLTHLGTPGPITRSKYTNTHDQSKALVSLCVPKRLCQSWESAFDDCRDADRALDALRFSECSLPPSGKFGITPLCWLEHAFRTSIGYPFEMVLASIISFHQISSNLILFSTEDSPCIRLDMTMLHSL